MTAPAAPQVPRAWLHTQLAAVRRRWWLIPAGLAATLLIAMLFLRQAEYVHTAELRVHAAPSSSGSRAASALGGLAALTGLGGASEQVSPFRFYLDGIYANEVAQRLANDKALMHQLFPAEWDAQGQRWRQPPSLLGSIRRGITGGLGLPQFGWQAPDGARMQAYIADTVSVRQSVKTPLVTISYSSADPALATAFLLRVHTTVDAWLREQQSRRTRANIAFLAEKLTTVTLAEQRQALVTALAEQERQAMLVYGDAPYAADPFDVPTVSPEPTRPRAGALLAGSAVAGLLIGLVLAVLLGNRAMRQERAAGATVPIDG